MAAYGFTSIEGIGMIEKVPICVADGCDSIGHFDKSVGKYRLKIGRCNKHYLRYRIHGQDELPVRPHAKKHPLYMRWKNMRSRCNNPNHPRYEDWGGRGIKICKEWDDFWAYARHIESLPFAYEKSRSLDRIDNDDDYRPGNMRWATVTEQNVNQRIRKDNTSGVKNLYRLSDGRWRVNIFRSHRTVRVGIFNTKQEATIARENALGNL